MAVIDLTKLIDHERERSNAERWQILGLSDLTQELPPIPWLCEPIGLAPGAVALFAGYGYSRKTMALQSLGLSIAAGRPAWGLHSVRKGVVLHLDYEQGRRITQERYQRLAYLKSLLDKGFLDTSLRWLPPADGWRRRRAEGTADQLSAAAGP